MLAATVLKNPRESIFDRFEDYAEYLVRIKIALLAKHKKITTCRSCPSLVLPDFAAQPFNFRFGIFEVLLLGLDLLVEHLDVIVDFLRPGGFKRLYGLSRRSFTNVRPSTLSDRTPIQ